MSLKSAIQPCSYSHQNFATPMWVAFLFPLCLTSVADKVKEIMEDEIMLLKSC